LLAIIGGTGFNEFARLKDKRGSTVATEFGSAYIEKGILEGSSLEGMPLLFLPRHGNPPRFPPHTINYQANIKALQLSGADEIIAVTAVGSVDPGLKVGELIVPDQIIDYTYGRKHTFFDEEIHHIDFSYPFAAPIREKLVSALGQVPDCPHQTTGVYGCTQGPRLESAAEIRKLATDGCTIVGMTAMPEAALARELDIAYAQLSYVVNPGAGINDQAIDIGGITAALELGMKRVVATIALYES